MSQPEVDLDSYFARIRYDGPRDVSLATLHALAAAQVRHIPFENLDVVLGHRIALDLPSVEKKLIHDRRGGYCFELNRYLLWILQALGFHARLLGARVRWKRPRHYTPERTHVFILVDLDGTPWLMDVGIGSLSLTSAIRFELDAEQPTPHEPRRIIRDGTRYFHQVHLADAWHDVCEFTLDEVPAVDCEVANWYTCSHPDSVFRNHILIARSAPDRHRVTLNDNILSHRDATGHAEKRELTTHVELLATLAEQFDIYLPATARIHLPGVTWQDEH